MKKIAVYPGSFDPIHNGHIDIINRIASHFDKVIVLIAESSEKKSLFTALERKKMIIESLKYLKNIEVDIFTGLTVEYMKKAQANIIVRGLRAVVDFEYEMTMANMNKKLDSQIETMLIFAAPEYYYISSRGIKEVARNNGALKGLVPIAAETALLKKYKKK